MNSIKPMVNQWLAVREEREELAARLACEKRAEEQRIREERREQVRRDHAELGREYNAYL